MRPNKKLDQNQSPRSPQTGTRSQNTNNIAREQSEEARKEEILANLRSSILNDIFKNLTEKDSNKLQKNLEAAARLDSKFSINQIRVKGVSILNYVAMNGEVDFFNAIEAAINNFDKTDDLDILRALNFALSNITKPETKKQSDIIVKKLFEIVKKRQIQIKLENQDWKEIILWASDGGYLEMVQYFLGIKPELIKETINSILTEKPMNFTLVTAAIMGNQLDVLKFLVEKGADINRRDISIQDTPLTAAIKSGNIEVVKYLLTQAVDRHEVNADNLSPIELACNFPSILELLLPLLNINNIDDKEELKKAVKHIFNQLFLNQPNVNNLIPTVKCFILLIKHGALNSVHEKDITKCIKAFCRMGFMNVVSDLLEILYKRDPNYDCGTHVFFALLSRLPKVANYFLQNEPTNVNIKIDVNYSEGTNTLLMLACSNNYTDCALILIERGADFCVTDGGGLTPLEHSVRNNNNLIAKFLLAKGAIRFERETKNSALWYAADLNILNMATLLIEADLAATKNQAVILEKSEEQSEEKKSETTEADQPSAQSNSLTPPLLSNRENAVSHPLHAAARKGHLDMIKLLIQSGADINALENGQYPVNIACRSNQIGAVQYLIAAGANIKGDSPENTALCIACTGGFHQIVALLLTQKKSLYDFDEIVAAFLGACASGNLNVVKLILKHNPDIHEKLINATGRLHIYGQTFPLKVAIDGGRKEIIEYLLSQNADLTQKSRYGETLYMTACKNALQQSTEIIDLIWAKGKDHFKLEYTLEDGSNVFHLVARHGAPSTMRMVLLKHPDARMVDNINANNESPLSIVCERGDVSSAQLLQENGADIYQNLGNGKSPLLCAWENRRKPATLMIVNKCIENNPQQLLIHACEMGNLELADYVVWKSASSSQLQPLKIDKSLLNLAILNNSVDLVAYLLQHPDFKTNDVQTRIETLTFCCRKGHHALLKKLIQDHKITTNDLNKEYQGATLLHVASEYGHVEIVNELIKNKVNIEKLTNVNQMTPLHLAAKNNHFPVVLALLANKAKADRRNGQGDMFIHLLNDELLAKHEEEIKAHLLTTNAINVTYLLQVFLTACEKRQLKLAEQLLTLGVNVNAYYNAGKTALHLACEAGNADVVEFLIKHGADLNATDNTKECRTPLLITCEKGNQKILNLLIQHGADCKINMTQSNQTPLYTAVTSANRTYEFIETIIHAMEKTEDANFIDLLNETNQAGHTALDVAVGVNDKKIEQLLIDKGATRSMYANTEKSSETKSIYSNETFMMFPSNPHKLEKPKKKKKNKNQEQREDDDGKSEEQTETILESEESKRNRLANMTWFDGRLNAAMPEIMTVRGPGVKNLKLYCPEKIKGKLEELNLLQYFGPRLIDPVVDDYIGLKHLKDIHPLLWEIKQPHSEVKKARIFCWEKPSDSKEGGKQATLLACFDVNPKGLHTNGMTRDLVQSLKSNLGVEIALPEDKNETIAVVTEAANGAPANNAAKVKQRSP